MSDGGESWAALADETGVVERRGAAARCGEIRVAIS